MGPESDPSSDLSDLWSPMDSSESRNRTSVGHLLPKGEGKGLGGATTPRRDVFPLRGEGVLGWGHHARRDVFPLRGERVAAMRRRVRGLDRDIICL